MLPLRERLCEPCDVNQLLQFQFVDIGFHAAFLVTEVHLVPEGGHLFAGALPDECGLFVVRREVEALPITSVAGSTVLVEKHFAALEVRSLDFTVLVEQLVHEESHAGVFAGECVFW